MVYKVKTFTRVDLELRMNTISLTLSKGFGVKSSGIAHQLIRDQFDRIKILLSQRKRNLKGMRYVFQSQIAAPSKHHLNNEMSIAALLIASLNSKTMLHIESAHFVGGFDLHGHTIPLDYPQEYFVAALSESCKFLVIPFENAQEVPEELSNKVIGIRSLDELIAFVTKAEFIPVYKRSPLKTNPTKTSLFYDQPQASRALELSIIGRHHLLLFGQPGIGKSMLIEQYSKALPRLSLMQKQHLWPIQVKRNKALSNRLPLEYVKVNTTITELYGGGAKAYPGYISLAHHGWLVADEIDQYNKTLLEAIKPALEWKEVLLERQSYSATYPSEFTLVGSCNSDLELTDNGLFSDSFLDRIDVLVKLQKPDMRQTLKVFNYHETSSKLEQALKYKSDFEASIKGVSPLKCLNQLPLSKEAIRLVNRVKDNEKSSVRRINRWLSTALSLLYIDQKNNLDEDLLLEALSFRKVI